MLLMEVKAEFPKPYDKKKQNTTMAGACDPVVIWVSVMVKNPYYLLYRIFALAIPMLLTISPIILLKFC